MNRCIQACPGSNTGTSGHRAEQSGRQGSSGGGCEPRGNAEGLRQSRPLPAVLVESVGTELAESRVSGAQHRHLDAGRRAGGGAPARTHLPPAPGRCARGAVGAGAPQGGAARRGEARGRVGSPVPPVSPPQEPRAQRRPGPEGRRVAGPGGARGGRPLGARPGRADTATPGTGAGAGTGGPGRSRPRRCHGPGRAEPSPRGTCQAAAPPPPLTSK